MDKHTSRVLRDYKKYGFWGLIKKILSYFFSKLRYLFPHHIYNALRTKQELSKILNGDYSRIILLPSTFGYNVPMFQRPQQIAHAFADSGCLVFYAVTPFTEKVSTIQAVTGRLHLINYEAPYLKRILEKLICNSSSPKYVLLYSTESVLGAHDIVSYSENGFGVIYDYVDELSPKLTGTEGLPKNLVEKYNYVMVNKNCFVVVTADLLWKDVVSKRGEEKLCLSSNGVDFDFFQSFEENFELEECFINIIDKGLPILCYYGALASWFDYDLIRKLAETCLYNIVLIGIKYDESFDNSKIDELQNVYFLGPRD